MNVNDLERLTIAFSIIFIIILFLLLRMRICYFQLEFTLSIENTKIIVCSFLCLLLITLTLEIVFEGERIRNMHWLYAVRGLYHDVSVKEWLVL